ncbi:hypothetical protein OOT46_18920 [Aquabacterium sp. A7-Y]|uniref:hypothetical protein n=1 Tax=Aquabacterium sp. A7-Y TaxID=1349605 RepID=UPI00223D104F|nr:hypothetical protein [Aquabacterium sp. A7-Y]MCW7539912.1 hypothetical protein [Aquabacterium sp. A7-Y]
MQLRRTLRDCRPLQERGGSFELGGRPVVELAQEGETLRAALVRRPDRSPEWERRVLADAAQVRQFIDEVKRRLANWSEE